MIRRLGREFVRPRTVFLVVSAAVFEFYYLTQYRPRSGENGWNVIYPALTTPQFFILIGVLWWNFILLENARNLAPVEVMLRFGSRSRAVFATLRENAIQLAVGCVAVAVVSVLISIPTGISLSWGEATLKAARSAEQADVFTTVTAARSFANPVEAIVALVLFAAVALLSSSIAYSAACVSGRAGIVSSISIGLYLWSAVCAFGAAALFPLLDAVNLYDYAWAEAQGSVYVVLGLWVIVTGTGILAVIVESVSGAISDAILRWWSILIVPVAAFGFSVGLSGAAFSSRWDAFFAGQYDSLVGYCRVACLIYVLGSISVIQFLEATDDQLVHVKIRYGTRWRWFRPHLIRAFLLGAVGGCLLTAAVAMSSFASDPHLDLSDVRLIALTTAGLVLSIWIVTTLGLLVATIFKSAQSWLWVAGVCFVAGYSSFVPLGRFNIFALYSSSFLDHQVNPLGSYLFALGFLCAIVIAVLALGVWSGRTTLTSRQAPIG
jgi:hypothetical protein